MSGASKRSRKEARRRKRKAAQNARWIPQTEFDELAEEVEVALTLEWFDQQLVERGWRFDEESSDDDALLWFYPPSSTEPLDDEPGEDDGGEAGDAEDTEAAPVTTILVTAEDDAEIAHVVFAGTLDDYQFDLRGLFDHIDVIEAYRAGDPLPTFD